jgi:hypothetical protein
VQSVPTVICLSLISIMQTTDFVLRVLVSYIKDGISISHIVSVLYQSRLMKSKGCQHLTGILFQFSQSWLRFAALYLGFPFCFFFRFAAHVMSL